MNGPLDFAALIEQCLQELRSKTAAHNVLWNLGKADWKVSQSEGQIEFTHLGITAQAPVQIVGTFSPEDSTWLWGWDHPSVVPGLQEDARRVRAFGEEHRLLELTTRKLICTEQDAWNYAALACKLSGAQGAYRGPTDTALVFMTFGDVRLKRSATLASGPDQPVPPQISHDNLESLTSAPAQVVRAFIVAYHLWNDAAIQRENARSQAGHETIGAIETANVEYGKLIRRFCAATVVPQGCSYGDRSMHEPNRERIEVVTISGSEALIQTRQIDEYEFVSNYEYHLVQQAGEWRIASLLYVDEDGKYECL